MFRSLALMIALATPIAAPALQIAPAPAGGLFSADQLRKRCISNVPADASYCFAYIAGIHDTVRAYEAWLNLREFCAPRRVAQGDLRRAFMDHVAARPADLPGEAASVVVVALKARFPCTAAR